MSDTDKFVWITKYALTHGIEKLPVREIEGGMVVCVAPDYSNGIRMEFGQDWHTDEQSAKEHAANMAKRKIASLEKQIQKLKVMSF